MLRLLFLLFCSVLASRCGLFDPSVRQLDMALGEYLLIATPAACPASDLRPGVGIMVSLAREDRDWVARSRSPAEGTVELRFREVADARVAGVALAGTLTGSGGDRRPFAASGAGVSFGISGTGSASAVSAQTTPDVLNTISGSVTGPILFRDDARSPLMCTRAEIALRLPEPCELDATVSCD